MKVFICERINIVNMALPKRFQKENPEDIFIYSYIEEFIGDYVKYLDERFKDENISETEFPLLMRIRLNDKTTQKELVELFRKSESQTAKILQKFEEDGYITRKENPTNRRQKLVQMTDEGIEKTDELLNIILGWETRITKNLNEDEIKSLKNLLYKSLE